eukprot:SAG22_NODE_611_length_8586_cov_8.288795_11_plen_312_part_00
MVRKNEGATRTLLPNFLAGVLKTKFAILWPAAIDAFVNDADRHFEDVWPLLSREMAQLQAREGDAAFMLRCGQQGKRKRKGKGAHGGRAEEQTEEDDAAAPEAEEEDEGKQGQDVNELATASMAADDGGGGADTAAKLAAEFEAWRTNAARITDYASYHKSIWTVLTRLTGWVFRKNKEVVPMFLDFLDQYKRQWGDGSGGAAEEEEGEGGEDDAKEQPSGSAAAAAAAAAAGGSNMLGVGKKLMNGVLCDYLGLFASFKDAGNMRGAAAVRAGLEGLLTKAEPVRSATSRLAEHAHRRLAEHASTQAHSM